MKSTLVTVPAGGNRLDVLAERYRAAFAKMNGGRRQWIDGTLDLAVVVAEARIDLPSNQAFGRWLRLHHLEDLTPSDRAALHGFSRDLKAARKMLEASNSISFRVIWEKQPKPPLPELGKRQIPAFRTNRSGASRRKEQAKLDPPSRKHLPPPEPGKRLQDMVIPREEIDPDFKGTELDWVTKYGHVNLHTKKQIEDNKSQDRLQAWIGAVTDLERRGNEMLTALAELRPGDLDGWMSKPGKREKLQAWAKRAQLASDALIKIAL